MLKVHTEELSVSSKVFRAAHSELIAELFNRVG